MERKNRSHRAATALTITFVLTLLILLGTNLQPVGGFPRTVIDDRCKEIRVTKKPESIVTLLPLYSEILADLGALDRIVGVADSPNNPPEVENITEIGPSSNPNRELVVALEPDIVFGATDFNKFREALETANLTVITTGCFRGVADFGSITAVTDVFQAIRTVGLTTQENTNKADALIGRISEEIILIESVVLGQPKRTAVVLYPDPSGKTPPFAGGRGAPENEIISRAGGINALSDFEGYPQISFEELLRLDPEFIFTDPSRIEVITSDDRLQGLRALVNGKVCGMKASQWTSSRVAETLRTLAQILHPQAFGLEETRCN